MNANFRVISTKVFPSTLIVFTPFIYKLHNFFVELSLSRTRFSEMKQSPLDSHRHCYHYEFYKKNTILLSMKDREKRKKIFWTYLPLLGPERLGYFLFGYFIIVSSWNFLGTFFASIRVQSIYCWRLENKKKPNKTKTTREKKWKMWIHHEKSNKNVCVFVVVKYLYRVCNWRMLLEFMNHDGINQ